MGDGHHGWAAAEIVLFLLQCLVRERNDTLTLFRDIREGMLQWGMNSAVQGIATSFGNVGCTINYQTREKALCAFTLKPISPRLPKQVEINFPFSLKRVLPVSADLDIEVERREGKTIVRFQSSDAMLLLEQ